jgi:FAD/FMN-containing dehydrogenase
MMDTTTLAAAVKELLPAFGGLLIQPEDPRYEAARRVFNGMVDKRPALIAQCRGAADIADAITFARKYGLEIAVRGGGHNVGGRGTIDAGIVIDLSPMKGIYIDPAARRARVQGGVLWREFNREAQLHGLATTGGVIGSTGVAGLTLGGGLGWLMSKYGMALDNLLSVELVLADGTVTRAAADENPDLFWAVRGGGGNFGVAASFEFQLHKVGPIVTGGLIAYPLDRGRDVLGFFRELTTKPADDMMDMTIMAGLITTPDGAKMAGLVAGHFGTLEEGAAAMQPLKQFGRPAIDALGPLPYTTLNSLLDDAFPRGARSYWKSHFMEQLSDGAIDTLVSTAERSPSPLSSIVVEHFGGAATRVPQTATAYALRSTGYNLLLNGQWLDAADDAAGKTWCSDAYRALEPEFGGQRYMNYMNDDDSGDAVLKCIYGPNLARLREVKAKYDPENVFHVNVNIPPR